MRLPFLLAVAFPFAAGAQVLVPTVITPLNTSLNETSGLVWVNGEIWTHRDSGGPNELYRVDPATGDVLRTVTVTNATNVDWEDIAIDSNWFYIADVGNNAGSRTDLRVYRVDLDELLDPGTSALLADTIRFAYPLQTDFTPAVNNNDWDCEALMAVDDSLFLFSKNWVSGTSYLYSLPATPGDQLAERRDTLDALGLVTGASYDPGTGAIALVGYSNGLFLPFVWRLAGYAGHALFQGIAQRNALGIGITQMEGIAWAGIGTAYLSNEQSILNAARLWELALDLPTGITIDQVASIRIWPSPNDGHFNLHVDQADVLEITDACGRMVHEQTLVAGENHVHAEGLNAGLYTAHLELQGSSARMFVQR